MRAFPGAVFTTWKLVGGRVSEVAGTLMVTLDAEARIELGTEHALIAIQVQGASMDEAWDTLVERCRWLGAEVEAREASIEG